MLHTSPKSCARLFFSSADVDSAHMCKTVWNVVTSVWLFECVNGSWHSSQNVFITSAQPALQLDGMPERQFSVASLQHSR